MSAPRPEALFRSGFLLVFFALSYVAPCHAGDVPDAEVSAKEVLEVKKATAEAVEEKSRPGGRQGRVQSTPLDTLVALREAIRSEDWEKAGFYLDRRYLPESMSSTSDEEVLKALSHVFRQQNIVSLEDVSDHPDGNLNDGLPSYRDLIGMVSLSSSEVPIYLQRVPVGDGSQRVWKVSNATVAELPAMWRELGYSPLTRYLGEHLPGFWFMGMESWQLLATLVFALLAWPLAMVASYIVLRLGSLIPINFGRELEVFIRRPLRFFLFINIARLLFEQLGLSLTARVLLQSSGLGYIAWTILLFGLLSLFRDFHIRKMRMTGNVEYVALLKPFTQILKAITAIVLALFWAQSAGYDMTKVLAGLGVGSLAVALAAQKTLENIIGALMIYISRPVSAGDFCRFGGVLGSIEEIGLRSTLIRTLDRTVVAIPNAVFSSNEIENFSRRDRYRYFQKLRLKISGSEQQRFILAELRKLLLSHPMALQETVAVRLQDIEDATIVVRLEAGIDTCDFVEFLAVAEDINLRVIEKTQEAGGNFCGPGQLLQLFDPESIDAEHLLKIELLVQEWRATGQLPFPDFSSEERNALKKSLDYPPRGSAE